MGWQALKFANTTQDQPSVAAAACPLHVLLHVFHGSRTWTWLAGVPAQGGGSRTLATDIIPPMYARPSQIKVRKRQPSTLCRSPGTLGSGAAKDHVGPRACTPFLLHAALLIPTPGNASARYPVDAALGVIHLINAATC